MAESAVFLSKHVALDRLDYRIPWRRTPTWTRRNMPEATSKHNAIETSIRALEQLLGISITVIDRDGVFHSPEGLSLLDYERQSHKKNLVCAHGFSNDACITHCRHEMNAQGAEQACPFVHTCWKGVQEVVVPLIHGGIHFGSLFAGIWRRQGTTHPPAAVRSAEGGHRGIRRTARVRRGTRRTHRRPARHLRAGHAQPTG